ncbi:hypothetical protein PROFUN_13063 [Planoprotostelium fungivorum]|uniref:Endonuclease/exonuclease/phosphatase domain-containing protein n=1 Tax=Planoprotostelium fungivorum TaxID=1890364 RepID=A0A2P6N5F7_9EUKA|nr:hypothetical protein PROFUN_13063 [Planoprotostelium fungivorum]
MQADEGLPHPQDRVTRPSYHRWNCVTTWSRNITLCFFVAALFTFLVRPKDERPKPSILQNHVQSTEFSVLTFNMRCQNKDGADVWTFSEENDPRVNSIVKRQADVISLQGYPNNATHLFEKSFSRYQVLYDSSNGTLMMFKKKRFDLIQHSGSSNLTSSGNLTWLHLSDRQTMRPILFFHAKEAATADLNSTLTQIRKIGSSRLNAPYIMMGEFLVENNSTLMLERGVVDTLDESMQMAEPVGPWDTFVYNGTRSRRDYVYRKRDHQIYVREHITGVDPTLSEDITSWHHFVEVIFDWAVYEKK